MRSYMLRAGIVIGAITLILIGVSLVGAADIGGPQSRSIVIAPAATFGGPTSSSPLALSQDTNFVWSVNPDDDSVSVIRTDLDLEVQRFHVGQEPQSIALDPNNRYAFVANAADNSVSVISITTYITPNLVNGFVARTFRTGAEPWNIVISPDGKRVYVANSGQDTISVIRNDTNPPTLLGNVTLDNTACNVGDPNRHFQPRGLAVTADNTKLYVTRFLSFVKSGGVQGDDLGKEGIVCRFDINTSAVITPGLSGFVSITLASQDSGFNSEQAYPNQMQSIVIRGNSAYLPNIASAPGVPLKFNGDTHAFVNRIDGVTGSSQTDGGAINLHLGARVPEAGKIKLFFANPWAMAFTNQAGSGNAYVVAAASDLVVKLLVDPSGVITFTGGVSTTRYIDLNDPNNPTTSGLSAGKNPLGIVICTSGPCSNKAYVMNYVSRNVSVINLNTDAVSTVVNLTSLPVPSTIDEQLQVGKEIFFSSRGRFDNPLNPTVPITNRLSSDGWQACSSCHFDGLTDGNIWVFNAGPRKSVPLNGTFSPHNPLDQRVLNYSAIFDEVEDFELNIRNVSGPGPLSAGPPPILDPKHGLIISDTGDINTAPAVINAFAKANAERPQLKVTLPGGSPQPALTALKEWVQFGIRTPNGALTTAELTAGGGSATGGLDPIFVAQGRRLFFQQGCQVCHGGTKWTVSSKDFTSPPAASEIATENPPITTTVNTQYLPRFLSNINSFNLNVSGAGNPITGTPSIGAIEKASTGQDALGKDYNADNIGDGFNIPSLLGIWQLPPYYHNGACETLNCVLANKQHRTANFARPDRLSSSTDQARVVEFLKSLDDQTVFPTNLSINRHDIFFDPPTVFKSSVITVGANIQLFGTQADLQDISNTLKVKFTVNGPAGAVFTSEVPLPAFTQDFGQSTVTTTWNVPANTGIARITVQVDSTDVFPDANEADNFASRLVLVRNPPPDTTPPVVDRIFISDDTPFDNNDPIVTTTNVQVRIVAHDPSSPPPASGLDSYCIVRYYYNVALRRWVESDCSFTPLPTPDSSSGDTFTYTVDATIPNFEGTAYAFAWVKDGEGNISRTPGFDVVSFIPSTPININRNDVRLFRILTPSNQTLTFTLPIEFGDVDVSVFDGVGVNASRIAISANNGTITETVTFSNTTGSNKLFQMEVRAVVNSRFSITYTSGSASLLFKPQIDLAPTKDTLPTTPLIAGPPALRTAIGDRLEVYLPLIRK